MKFKPTALGLALGTLWGVSVLIMTWVIVLEGRHHGHTLITLSNFYLGYTVSYLGGIVGLVWGFVDGYIGGHIFAMLYNRFAKEE